MSTTGQLDVEWDKDKLAEDEKYDGYYLLCTNVIGTTHILHNKKPDFAYYRNDGFLTFVFLIFERVLEYTMDWKYSAASIQYSLSHLNGQQLPNFNVYLFAYYYQIIRDIKKSST